MLKIRYDLSAKVLSGWTDIESEFDELMANKGEDVAILDILKPSVDDYEYFLFDATTQSLVDNPAKPKPEPPYSTHISTIDAIDTAKARPVRIKRVWEGRDYFYDCFVTESVKDQFVAGDVVVGDYVLVHFDDIREQIVTAKVFKSWA